MSPQKFEIIFVFIFLENLIFLSLHQRELLLYSLEMIGAIFDSCPGPVSAWGVPFFFPFTLLPCTYGYFHWTISKKSLLESIYKLLTMLPVSFLNYFKFGGTKHWPGVYLTRHEQEKWPLLFLYSKKDVMIPHLYISHVISTKRQQNPSRIISAKLFDNSAHTAHLRKYPEEYKNEIKQFLDKC